MKIRSSIIAASVLIGVSVITSGCGGGGTTSTDTTTPTTVTSTSTASTSVSGTTGSGSSDLNTTSSLFTMNTVTADTTNGIATLIVDSSGDNLLGPTDTKYSVAIKSDGSFVFDDVAVDETKEVKAQLTVEKDGFAPVVKTLTLTKDTPLSVLAEIDTKPVLTEVQTLPTDAAARANSFLKFGITQSSTGIKTFSKLMTLSELQAEADVGLGANTLSESTIPVAAFASDVTSVTAKMQAFDSTKEEDIALFPGEFSGHGKAQLTASATADSSTEEPLESAAFDMIKLTDQNGDDIELQSIATSKLSALADAASCNGMFWTRRVTSSQALVIENWGDDDNDTSNGFQVPIWSNDNSTGTWEYIGLGDWNASTSSFSACVDKKWQGYLNCDSVISVGEPQQICVNAADQNGDPFGGVYVQGKNGNSYNYDYLDNNGEGVVAITTGTPSEWEFTYYGSITGWSRTAIDNASIVSSTTTGCDYDMNITIDNPYSAEVYVYAMDENNESLSSVYVQLQSSSYSDYYSKGAYTNDKGYAIFKVKPNVEYTAKYKAGTSLVNVNSIQGIDETADSGKYASVEVQDGNVAPVSYIYPARGQITTTAESLRFYISASDANRDTLTISSVTLGGTELTNGTDYEIEYNYSSNGYLYLTGKLDLNSSTISALTPQTLSNGTYTLNAVISDGKLSATASTQFTVAENQAPVVYAIYLRDSNYNYYYESSVIPVGTYTVDAYAYDVDGDTVTKVVSVDGVTTSSTITLAQGEHNVTVTADDGALSSSRTITIYVGNHAPEITNAGATNYRVDVNAGETFKLYAYAEDLDYGDSVTVTATDANGTVYPMTKLYTYGTKYESAAITLTSVNAKNNFYILANDGESNSTVATVSVESFAENQVPIFTKELSDTTVNINTATTFECSALDPEGTFVNYTWSLDGQALSETTGSYTTTFSATGVKNLTCTATDGDGKTATSNATLTIINPTVTSTLTVHTGMPNIKVALHDMSTLKVTQEKSADANGDASFSVTGDRTTFSISSWPGMIISDKTLLKLVKEEFMMGAYYTCDYNASAATECSSADWCAISTSETIPTWIWDLGAANDTSGSTPASTLVDTSGDGEITVTELYTAALTELDTDQSGDISFSEFNGDGFSVDVQVDMFANVPVREYYINPSNGYDDMHMEMFLGECSLGAMYFDTNLTLHTTDLNSSISGYVSGSGYGSTGTYDEFGYYTNYVYADGNGNVNVPVSVYQTDTDGTYSFLLRGHPDTAQQDYFYFLPGKTKAELDAGITLNLTDFVPADTNVTMYHDSYTDLYINAYYKGLWFDNQTNNVWDTNTTSFTMYTNNNFTYMLNGYSWSDQPYNYNGKNHYGYYGDGTLQTSYNSADYPMLDVNPIFDQNGKWSISGTEMDKVNNTSFYVDLSGTDYNTSIYYNVRMNVNWTVAPSQMPDVNVTEIVPADLQDAVANAVANSSYSYINLDVIEFKGLTESEFITAVAGSVDANEYSLYMSGQRSAYADYNPYYTAYSTMTTESKDKAQKRRVKKPFTIGYDVSKLFSK